MQEASSVAKAVQLAWQDAGNPKEFTVKVFEEPVKNFLGMTIKSAKIGISFQDRASKKRERSRPKAEARPQKSFETNRPSPERKATRSQNQVKQDRPKREARPQEAVQKERPKKEERPAQERPTKIMWTDDMIKQASEWLSTAMATMSKSDVSFSTQANNYYLRFTFDGQMAETPEKERQLFRSFSFLMMQALKQQLKRPLRGFKVVLTRES